MQSFGGVEMSTAGQENLLVAIFVQLMSRKGTTRFSTWWTTLPRNSEDKILTSVYVVLDYISHRLCQNGGSSRGPTPSPIARGPWAGPPIQTAQDVANVVGTARAALVAWR